MTSGDRKHPFDVVDLDPYGSPCTFLDAAVRVSCPLSLPHVYLGCC